MDSVSRPLIALLLGTVAVFAVWLVALKPSSSSSGGGGASSPGVYASAIAKAHQALATSAAASVAHGGTVITATPMPRMTTGARRPVGATAAQPVAAAAQPVASAATRSATKAVPPARRSSTNAAWQRMTAVARALKASKTLALLFYNPAGADDLAVRTELAAVPAQRGRVVKLAVPLAELAHYAVVTNQVTVNASPTLVLIDSTHHASTLVGFADRFEIAQRVADALAAR